MGRRPRLYNQGNLHPIIVRGIFLKTVAVSIIIVLTVSIGLFCRAAYPETRLLAVAFPPAFTSSEIAPCCSAVPPMAGLRSKINPVGFNAPVEFLTGFTYKPLSGDSVIMLIGDFYGQVPPDPVFQALKDRIDLAVQSGVDTVLIVFPTSGVEDSFEGIDLLVSYAADNGIGVIPRIIVDSKVFSEFIFTTAGPSPEWLPAYTNMAQLDFGVELLKNVVGHLEQHPNIVAYQIEWGHYGESWINAPFWDSPSSVDSFLDYLNALSPGFSPFNSSNIANWAFGQVMYYGRCLPEGDVRKGRQNVAEFHWYQKWRNEITRQIAWTFRQAARTVTSRPIAGFSYVVGGPDGVIGHAYNAHQYLDVAFSDWVPYPVGTHKNFIRDAYFNGLHLGELDFDTPYFSLADAEQAVAGMYARGIVPVIFYPLWSSALRPAHIAALVQYINEYKSTPVNQAQVLVVYGRHDIGVISPSGVGVIAEARSPLTAEEPSGILPLMLSKGIVVDVVSPEVYTPALGNLYQAVIVVAPHDSIDREFQNRMSQTTTNVLIVHPSFLIGTPVAGSPLTTKSGFCEKWNPLVLKGRSVRLQVWGIETIPARPNPQVHFLGPLGSLGTIQDYLPNRSIFSYYRGSFDEIYATAEFSGKSYPTIGRIGNIVLFGLVINLFDETQKQTCQAAFLTLLQSMGVFWEQNLADGSSTHKALAIGY